MSVERFPNQSGTGILGAATLVGSLAWASFSSGRGASEPAPYTELTPPAATAPSNPEAAASMVCDPGGDPVMEELLWFSYLIPITPEVQPGSGATLPAFSPIALPLPAVQQPHQVLFAASLSGEGERIDLGPQLTVLQEQLNVPLSNEAFTRDWTWIQALVREINEVKNARLTDEQCAAIAGEALLTYKRYEVQAANDSKLSREDVVQLVNLATREQRIAVFLNFGQPFVNKIELLFQKHTPAGG